MFFITAAIYAFGTIFYDLFGSGQLQPWAMSSDALHDAEIDVNEEKEQKSADIAEDCIRSPFIINRQTDNSTDVDGDVSAV